MSDIRIPRLLYFKGVLFLIGGLLASAGLWMDRPTWKVVLLLTLAVWCFCRAYYFAFYVIQHYIDPGYRFSGLGSFVRYVMRMRK